MTHATGPDPGGPWLRVARATRRYHVCVSSPVPRAMPWTQVERLMLKTNMRFLYRKLQQGEAAAAWSEESINP